MRAHIPIAPGDDMLHFLFALLTLAWPVAQGPAD